MAATIGEVLRHLVTHVPGLSDDNRAEHLAAVDEAFPQADPEPAEDPEPEPAPGA